MYPFRTDTVMNNVVELGPGDSLGIGFSALLAGAKKYIAVDAVKYADLENNLEILDELETLFSTENRIPDSKEFPKVKPLLDNYDFPKWLSRPVKSNLNQRVKNIRHTLRNPETSDAIIAYHSPELADIHIANNSVDLIFSQAVFEHVNNLDLVYKKCYKWLAPGGLMSHQIDFKSHGIALEWNGHWTYSPFLWRMIKGRRPYLINRQPCSTHIRLMRETGFEILSIERHRRTSRLKQAQLSRDFYHLDTDDLTTAGVYVIAKKPESRIPQTIQRKSPL
jgi:SAM-dependent methyltransferase